MGSYNEPISYQTPKAGAINTCIILLSDREVNHAGVSGVAFIVISPDNVDILSSKPLPNRSSPEPSLVMLTVVVTDF